MTYFLPALVTLAFTMVAHLMALPKTFGAHPWWATQALWVGFAIGVALALLAARFLSAQSRVALVFFVGFILAFGAAKYGQTQFAASYAEDALAGKIWFFGWHATAAMGAATVASLAAKALPLR